MHETIEGVLVVTAIVPSQGTEELMTVAYVGDEVIIHDALRRVVTVPMRDRAVVEDFVRGLVTKACLRAEDGRAAAEVLALGPAGKAYWSWECTIDGAYFWTHAVPDGFGAWIEAALVGGEG